MVIKQKEYVKNVQANVLSVKEQQIDVNALVQKVKYAANTNASNMKHLQKQTDIIHLESTMLKLLIAKMELMTVYVVNAIQHVKLVLVTKTMIALPVKMIFHISLKKESV